MSKVNHSSWKNVKLGALITESRIPSSHPNSEKRIRVKLNIGGVEKRPNENEIEGATKQFVRKAGQFIYGKQNFHKGAFGVIPDELDGFESSADIPSFDVRNDCLVEWLFYYFKIGDRYKELEKLARGVGSKRIHPDQISDIDIPLPPINEQKSLIKRFHRLEIMDENLVDETNKQLAIVKSLRQAFLREAMQGKLVPQDKNDEPASVLLERIKAEKQKLIAEGKLKKEKPLPLIKPEEIPYEIPNNWVWCRLGVVCTKIGSGSTPRGSNYSKNGVPFFRSQNIVNDRLDFSDIKFISSEIHKNMSNTAVKPGDVLLNITGGSLGRCAQIPYDVLDGNVSQHVCIIRSVLLNTEYLNKMVMAPGFQTMVFSSTTGAGREGLPKYNLERFLVPIPPLSEQDRIVHKLNEILTSCNELETCIKESKAQAEMLLQTALKEALG